MKTKHSDSDLIDAMGGTVAVAKMCEVKPPSVSEWRYMGIPRARLMYLKLVCPDAFTRQAATGDQAA